MNPDMETCIIYSGATIKYNKYYLRVIPAFDLTVIIEKTKIIFIVRIERNR